MGGRTFCPDWSPPAGVRAGGGWWADAGWAAFGRRSATLVPYPAHSPGFGGGPARSRVGAGRGSPRRLFSPAVCHGPLVRRLHLGRRLRKKPPGETPSSGRGAAAARIPRSYPRECVAAGGSQAGAGGSRWQSPAGADGARADVTLGPPVVPRQGAVSAIADVRRLGLGGRARRGRRQAFW